MTKFVLDESVASKFTDVLRTEIKRARADQFGVFVTGSSKDELNRTLAPFKAAQQVICEPLVTGPTENNVFHITASPAALTAVARLPSVTNVAFSWHPNDTDGAFTNDQVEIEKARRPSYAYVGEEWMIRLGGKPLALAAA